MSKQIISLGKPAVSTDKYPDRQEKKLFCGIDIGAETLAIAVMELDHPWVQREFANSVAGHKALLSVRDSRIRRVAHCPGNRFVTNPFDADNQLYNLTNPLADAF